MTVPVIVRESQAGHGVRLTKRTLGGGPEGARFRLRSRRPA